MGACISAPSPRHASSRRCIVGGLTKELDSEFPIGHQQGLIHVPRMRILQCANVVVYFRMCSIGFCIFGC